MPQQSRSAHFVPHFFALSIVLCVAFCPPAVAQQPTSADTIYIHGNILTGEGLGSPSPMRASALAIRGGIIVATGPDNEIVAQWRGAKTLLVDLHGAFAIPGFNDAHVHFEEAGLLKLQIDLIGCQSLAEMKQRIRTGAAQAPAGAWLQGRGWDHTLWARKDLPTRQDLDRVTGGHPGIFIRVDGHIAVANSAALDAAGIAANTADPAGGKIDRDANRQPTGIVRETAADIIYRKIPPPTAQQRRAALLLAIQDAIRSGVTSAQDNSPWEDFLVFEQLEREGKLPLRVTEWLTFLDPLETLQQHRLAHSAQDPLLHTGMLKGFMDGSLGSRTAALLAPYADDPQNAGLPQFDQQQLNQMTVERAKAGFQIGFHAIGDRAASMALDAFAAAEASGFGKDSRFRIEHAQVVAPQDFERFQRLGVIASVQPNHLLTDMNWAEDRIGWERAKTSYAWKTFLDHHVVLVFGTDYPVEPVAPFRGLYAAVTRMNEAETREYFPGQKLTIGQAIAAYTQGSAYAEFAEKTKGQLMPGYMADFVVLNQDITVVAPERILNTQVLRTVVAGKTVYQAAHVSNRAPQEKK